ncbi:unnamed protein product [Symbiodinium microadriaticum]|nr:unnamed protein product [Symbiodinium microadriaticum]
MSGPGKDEERPRLERFDGSQPSTYRRWRRKAELMLLALPTTYTKDRWGAKLLEYVAGEAEEVCEALPLDKIIKEGGHTLILEALDERYKELQKEALHNHLQEYFYGLQIKPGETFRNMMVRLDSAYRRLREHSVELPTEVRGWFVLRKLQLGSASEAMLMTHTKGSLKYEDVVQAIQAIYPQGAAKTGGNRTKEIFEAAENGVENDSEELVEDVFQAVAEHVQSSEEYDDEDALDVFETYKEVRKRLQQKRLGRGYKAEQGQQWKLSGTVKGKLEMLKSKTKCHLCHERGHWKRECPRRGQSSGAVRQQRPSSSNEAMVADDFGENYKSIEDEHFLDVDELGRFEIFLAERGDGVEVVVADRQEAIDDGGEVKGDFERSLTEFLSSSQFSESECNLHEAYMADCADLAEHGNHEFRFGNSGTLRTSVSALIPVCLGGKQLAIRAAVLPEAGSETPLLLSKELLRKLQVKLDMGNDRIEIGRYGVNAKLRETSRGHYALPLFEGMHGCRVKKNVQSGEGAKTHEIMSYTGAADMDIPMGAYRHTPLIADLMAEVTSQSAGEDQLTDIDAKILDEAPDHSDDDRDAVVPGSDGYLGQRVFNVGKYQKSGQLMTFKVAYETDKRYVAWVRKFIKGRATSPDKTNHPTMTQFRLYIAIRDQMKTQRIMMNPAGIHAASRSSTQPPVVMAARAKTRTAAKAAPKSRATSGPQGSVAAHGARAPQGSNAVWEEQWIVTQDPETEETPQERRRRQLCQRIQELTNQLEELDENAEW